MRFLPATFASSRLKLTRYILPLLLLIWAYISFARPFANQFRRQQLYRLLISTAHILDQCDVTYTLDQGTLLGTYRDGQIIEGDTDIDILLIGWDQRLRLLKCERDFGYFAENGLRFLDDRNPNGGIAVRDEYQFYVDVDTASLIPDDPEGVQILRDTTLPHCQPDVITTGSHRTACERPLDMMVDVCKSCLSVHWPAGCENKKIVSLHGPCTTGEMHGVYKFSAPNRTEDFLATKYPDWKIPRSMDKGTDTTPGDTFKAHIHFIVEFCQVVIILTRWIGVYIAGLIMLTVLGGSYVLWRSFRVRRFNTDTRRGLSFAI